MDGGGGGGGEGSRDMGYMTTVTGLCLGKLIKIIEPIDANWKLMTNIQIVVLTQLYIGESISSSVQL